jgi:hypothetical protein
MRWDLDMKEVIYTDQFRQGIVMEAEDIMIIGIGAETKNESENKKDPPAAS